MLQRIEFLPADATGLSPLARAARAGVPVATGLRVPRSLSELEPPSLTWDGQASGHLARWLESRLTRLSPHVRTLESVRALAEPRAVCVLASVRPGLLLSPLSGLWNALACVRLAEVARAHWQRPVVPVVWIRADEGALAECGGAWVPNRHHELQRVRLPGGGRGEGPEADLALTPDGHRLPGIRAFLAQLYGDHPALEEALDTLLPAPGESLAGAAARALLRWFGPRGLVVVEPEWLRDEGSQALAALVVKRPAEALGAAWDQLARQALVERQPPEPPALVQHLEGGERRPLSAGGEGYRYAGEPGSRTGAELAAQIVQDPRRWSAGPPLAPLIAERLLPVAAHVGAEDELARQALLPPLRARLGAAPLPFVLRAPVTLIDEETARSLARSGLDAARALRGAPPAPPDDGGERPPVLAALAGLFAEAAERLLECRAELGAIEASLPRQLERAVGRARGEIERVLHKAERVAGDRSGRGRRDARRLQTVLFPRGAPQECALSPFTFVARYGSGWIDELAAEWEPFGAEHLAVFLAQRSA